MSETYGSSFVSPTGYVDLDNDCQYSIDLKSTRSREYVDPKEDLSFYFNTYIVPKYGLNNINVSNVASFMKELQMNWTKLTPDLKDNVLNIMTDDIFVSGNYDFKSRLLNKIGYVPPQVESVSSSLPSKSSFGKSNFGDSKQIMYIVGGLALLVVIIFIVSKKNNKPLPFSRMI
jgi:hypothetical protein